jgi:hypothetical protein
MKSLFQRSMKSLKRDGLNDTLYKAFTYPFRRSIYKKRVELIFATENLEDRFTKIYKFRHWGRCQSASGGGSTLEATENLRRNLLALIKQKSIRSIFDAPCGDFNWMRHVLKECPLDYVGADIVSSLIDSNNAKHKNQATLFVKMDLTRDRFPNADLMFCRDCLFHLSYKDTKLVLLNFIDSKIPYLLTTTHVNSNDFQNKDISSGAFRLMDLFSAPYNFPTDVLYRFEDSQEPPRREMCLWTRGQVIAAVTYFQEESPLSHKTALT